jgi:ubiquinone/menaquinone biosynthesis C-methylase UbiE
MMSPMRPAVAAFDAIAPFFDQRFGAWRSVAAQRRAVREALLREFPKRGHILELGGGTGEDAAFLAATGYEVFLTDPSPTMVALRRPNCPHLTHWLKS